MLVKPWARVRYFLDYPDLLLDPVLVDPDGNGIACDSMGPEETVPEEPAKAPNPCGELYFAERYAGRAVAEAPNPEDPAVDPDGTGVVCGHVLAKHGYVPLGGEPETGKVLPHTGGPAVAPLLVGLLLGLGVLGAAALRAATRGRSAMAADLAGHPDLQAIDSCYEPGYRPEDPLERLHEMAEGANPGRVFAPTSTPPVGLASSGSSRGSWLPMASTRPRAAKPRSAVVVPPTARPPGPTSAPRNGSSTTRMSPSYSTPDVGGGDPDQPGPDGAAEAAVGREPRGVVRRVRG